MAPPEAKADFLAILDGLVHRDGAATGLKGEVCIGLRGEGGHYRWWRARLGPRFSTRFLSTPSATAHVTLFLGEADADAVLRTGRVPAEPDLLMIDGDRDLFARFIKRYTSRTNWLGVRLGRH